MLDNRKWFKGYISRNLISKWEPCVNKNAERKNIEAS